MRTYKPDRGKPEEAHTGAVPEHNYGDNTSGVCALIELAAMPPQRARAAFAGAPEFSVW